MEKNFDAEKYDLVSVDVVGWNSKWNMEKMDYDTEIVVETTFMEKNLIVAETFYSLQCEGRAIGTPAVFLRLGGCNLLCKSKDWVCDTIEVWKKGKSTKFEDVIKPEWVQRLRQGAHLVITGGEPLIHQHSVSMYLFWFEKFYGFVPFIEVETNGTIIPIRIFADYVKWWNVSPKLSNSGMTVNQRINEAALLYFNDQSEVIFKFVICNESDIQEMFQDYTMIDFKKVVLMPAGATQVELTSTRLMVAQQCIDLGLRYSERLHIVIWNQKTGV